MGFQRVLKAIEDIKNGKMIVMVDDEDRENEGDIVFSAAFSDVQKVNFMITHAKGVVCTPLSKELADKFELYPMVGANTSSHDTAFTISIDAKKASTGVSAYERDMTIKMLVDGATRAGDFVRPGHIFPLIAKSGGVLERTGHTEGSIDLCRLAGLAPVSVICEIVNDDGTMARRDDLEKFCDKFGLNMVSIAEIIEYRLHHEKLISVSELGKSQIAGKNANKYSIMDHLGNTHYAFIFGDIKDTTNVKFHKIKDDIELLNSHKFSEFISHIDLLDKDGGILIFLAGNEDDGSLIKNYGIGAQILKYFGASDIKILSSSESKEFVAIKGFGLNILGQKS
ncbi:MULTISPECIES: bifunctional 3,4-dihydroxy-2-butanone 4-phosphate synthase/GTP cyclohydrolase II [Campylobacter]|uniref:bifunctional 3,4-dihydroxy-2-butanone 4-phosphate synthase/GTP cyclohydrolase II n=1 Tax=Campylobacter TaxID=194 RepID=UPI000A3325A3|nr:MULTISPECIES: bifunctional 3,4-dihydroxy-2-butanone 4-phosphate synthase/GTP cyclohydrolase II [unclassified Campylobacter]MCR8678447.1 bifunctional 3,4-dihydroxy-2-butanone 4-phosphate synthase/GTP cyclohydrolase II [Campylobacter sp. RM19072]MCR8695799.1 bifunctional 3,4-dihydroxy-2-butanone 4-phosphate synthase/GTP cyclohydrolase II [Campylobacter sp. RM19073]